MPQTFTVPFNGSRASGDPSDAAKRLMIAINSGFDPVKLAGLRDARSSELQARIGADLRAGDQGGLRDAAGSKFLLDDVTQEMSADPYTGDDEQARVGRIGGALDSAQTFMRDDVGQAARTGAERNAFSKFLLDKTPYQAMTSPEGEQALDEASQRRTTEARAGFDSRLAFNDATVGERARQSAAAKPPSTQVQTDLKNLDMMEVLGPRILAKFAERYPGIDTNPKSFGGHADMASEKGKKLLYNIGVDTRDEDLKQLIGLFRIIGAQPYMKGRPSEKIFEEIVSHLPDIGFSPGSDYERVQQLMEKVPELRRAVLDSSQPLATQRQQFDEHGARKTGLPSGVTVTREP